MSPSTTQPPKTSEVDLLIIGAGAAGTMAATCCAAYGLHARVIDKRPAKILAGHADGIASRMMEILHSFGLAEKVLAECGQLVGLQFWDADNERLTLTNPGKLWKWHTMPSQFENHTLSQARLQDLCWEYISKRSDIRVERGLVTEALHVDPNDEHPVHVTVRTAVDNLANAEKGKENVNNSIRLDDDREMLELSQQAGGEQEIIKAKYVMACDGAHSWTRRQLNIPMLGDETDIIWGAMDVRAITDFPNARLINYIVSKEQHSGLLWIPREKGLTRIYCVVDEAKTGEDGKFQRSSVSEETLFRAVRKNMKQYSIDYKYCEWWAAYQIGQRVAADNIDPTGRIFLMGDACHTHSPKAGQGMNVSVADSHNLVWKLNLVLKGLVDPKILQSYREERLAVAQRLVNFDRTMAAMASGLPPPEVPEGTIAADDLMTKSASAAGVFIRGFDVVHPPSSLVVSTPDVADHAKSYFREGVLPPGIVTGMRMPAFDVRLHSDTKIKNVGNYLRSEGCKFRFVLFVGDITTDGGVDRLRTIARNLETLALPRSTFEVLTIHTSLPHEVDEWITNLPDFCHPFDEETGYDYDKLFYDRELWHYDGAPIRPAYERYEVDRVKGRLVVLRPDNFVAYQGELEDFDPVRKYFQGFMLGLNTSTNGHTSGL